MKLSKISIENRDNIEMNDDEECKRKWEEIEEKIKVNKNFSVLN